MVDSITGPKKSDETTFFARWYQAAYLVPKQFQKQISN